MKKNKDKGARHPRKKKGAGPRKTRERQVGELVALILDEPNQAELFHGTDRTPFAAFAVGPHRETWPLRSDEFEHHIGLQFYRTFGCALPPKDLKEAMEQLVARALFDGPERRVFTRVGEHEGAIFVDLCDEAWRVVRIAGEGWQLLGDSPVKFARAPGMSALPAPASGGAIGELDRFINISEGERPLFLACLVADFHPRGPYPVTVIEGEHGSGKTTLARIRRALVDPSEAPTQSRPRSERDLRITAANSWLVVLDNLSHLDWRLSDSLCRLATGGGLRIRKHYKNRSEQIFNSTRPVVITSIESLPNRADFLDRCAIFHVPRIEASSRQTEAEFWAQFDAARPRILGAVFDAVAAALRNIGSVRLDQYPRMADFARWGVAAEPGLGLAPESFLRAYEINRRIANEAAIEASPIAEPLFHMLDTGNALKWRRFPVWSGDIKQLLKELEIYAGNQAKANGWPRSHRQLRAELDRLRPNLRAEGVLLDLSRRDPQTRRRIIQIRKADTSDAPDAPAANPLKQKGGEASGASGASQPAIALNGELRISGACPARAV